MTKRFLAPTAAYSVSAVCCILLYTVVSKAVFAETIDAVRPRAGKVEIFRKSNLKPGMKATAWTVFSGTSPEAVPVEIVGLWKNANGPKQDIILGKMGGKAIRTNVAGGMSGSPVYIDGKLVGAVALRFSVFSPDAICGITPIELMLEVNGFDNSRPEDARTPEKSVAQDSVQVPSGMLAQVLSANAASNMGGNMSGNLGSNYTMT